MMTNFEKATAESWNTHGITAGKPKKGIAADESVIAAQSAFAEALSSAATEKAVSLTTPGTDPDVTVPEHWTDDDLWGYGVAALRVNKFLKELGIDTTKRKPTYEITDEQREWLASRHDFEAIKNGGDSKELGELLGDLIYMNVISAGDAVDMMSPGLPIPDGQTAQLTYLGDFDNFPDDIDMLLERIKKFIEMHRRAIELNSAAWSVDYIEKTHKFLKTKETCCELLSSLLSPVSDKENVTEFRENRNVTDASDQLKVDFGALLA